MRSDEILISLELLDRIAKALPTCMVDDVHLGNRFGVLLRRLSKNLKTKVALSVSGDYIADHLGESPALVHPSTLPVPADLTCQAFSTHRKSLDANSGDTMLNPGTCLYGGYIKGHYL